MPRLSFQCPNCESEMCSAIKYWREGKQTEFYDVYKCHDCGQCTDPSTRKALPADWQPARKPTKAKVQAGQMDLYGAVADMRAIINPVPKLVESPAGLVVGVYKIPHDPPIGYKVEIARMMNELNVRHTGRQMPHWYKYRKIKRGKK